MSYKYRILRKTFQQAPPSTFQREQVKKDLSGNTSGFIMLQTSMRYIGHPQSGDTKYTLQEEEKLTNPSTCQSYLIDYGTADYTTESVYYELVITYYTYDGPKEAIVKIRPNQSEGKAVPPLVLTFYPYDIKNPNDNSQYSYAFSTTNLSWAILGRPDGIFFHHEEISPDANNGRWIIYTGDRNDQMTPQELCYNTYFTFSKYYSDYSFHIRTVIESNSDNPSPFIYSNVYRLLPVYMDSRYPSPLNLFHTVRDNTLPTPYT